MIIKLVVLIIVFIATNVHAESYLGALQNSVRKVIKKAKPAVVYIDSRRIRLGGTGAIIDERGYIITNYHVTDSAGENPTVELHDGTKYKGKVVGYINWYELSIVKITGKKPFPTLPLGDSSKVEKGDFVIAYGNPYGYKGIGMLGIISGVKRVMTGMVLREKTGRVVPVIQTDVKANPGNSGGPLLNLKGEIIGITDAIYHFHPYGPAPNLEPRLSTGITFAIPSNIIKEYLDDMIAGKRYETRKKEGAFWIGARFKNVRKNVREKHKIRGGVLVENIDPWGPAFKSDLRKKDMIIKADSKPILNVRDINIAISLKIPGDTISLDVLRNGKRRNVKVKVARFKRTYE